MPSLHDIVTKGSVDRSVVVHIMDSTDGTPETGVVFNTSGIDLWYRREGAARVAITEATLAALTTAHTDGGFLHVSDGDYRLDLPDAAFATGANYVDFGGTVTGMIVIGGRVRLIDASLEVANLAANMVQISGDSTAADNLETAFDDTAGPVPWFGIVDQGTAQSATSTTVVLRSASAFADDTLIGATIAVLGSTQGYWQTRLITDSVLSTDTVTVDAWTVTPSGTITYKIYGTAPSTGAGTGLDAAGVRAALGMSSANLDTQLSNIDNFIDTEIATIQATLTTIDAKIDTVDNFLDTEVAAIQTAVVTTIPGTLTTIAGYLDTEIAAILADTNELQTDWANGGRLDNILDARSSQSSLDTLAGYVDTEVNAIKTKTDQLTFGATNAVNVNVTHVIADPVQQSGANDTNWGGAP